MNQKTTLAATSVAFLFSMFGISPQAAVAVCIVPNVGGTAELPPVGCDYVAAPGDLIQILPPSVPAGNSIDMEPTLTDYSAISEVAGGLLGGHSQTYNANLELSVSGTGGVLGIFARSIFIPVAVETHSASRTPGNAIQSFCNRHVQHRR